MLDEKVGNHKKKVIYLVTSFFLCKDDPMHLLKVVTGAVFLYYHLTGRFFSMILIFRKLSNMTRSTTLNL